MNLVPKLRKINIVVGKFKKLTIQFVIKIFQEGYFWLFDYYLSNNRNIQLGGKQKASFNMFHQRYEKMFYNKPVNIKTTIFI